MFSTSPQTYEKDHRFVLIILYNGTLQLSDVMCKISHIFKQLIYWIPGTDSTFILVHFVHIAYKNGVCHCASLSIHIFNFNLKNVIATYRMTRNAHVEILKLYSNSTCTIMSLKIHNTFSTDVLPYMLNLLPFLSL